MQFSSKNKEYLVSTIFFFDRADSNHANIDRAVHLHRRDFAVSMKLESRIRELKRIAVVKVLADGVVVDDWIRTAIFKDRERFASISDVAIVDDESQVPDRHRRRNAEKDRFTDNLFVESYVCEVAVGEE